MYRTKVVENDETIRTDCRKVSIFWQIFTNKDKIEKNTESLEKRAAEKGIENAFEVLAGGRISLQNIVARDACETAGEKIGSVNTVLSGTFGQAAAAVENGIVQAVLQKIQDVVADKKGEDITAVRDVEAVGVTEVLQGQGGAAALMALGVKAVLALQFEGDDVVLGLEEGVEGLAGDAGTFADLAHADAGIGFFLHQAKKRVGDGGL